MTPSELRRYKLSALDIPLPVISWRRKPEGKWTVTDYKGFCVGVPHGTGSIGVVSELHALYESGR